MDTAQHFQSVPPWRPPNFVPQAMYIAGPPMVCEFCGAVVADPSGHIEWHVQVYDALRALQKVVDDRRRTT